MLVLSRHKHEVVVLTVFDASHKPISEIEVSIEDIRGDKVRIGFEAPQNVMVRRKELDKETFRRYHDQKFASDDTGTQEQTGSTNQKQV